MGELWRRVLLFLEIGSPQVDQQAEEVLLIQKAWLEWQAAHRYYQAVSDPDLVEYAIFAIKAAETKYRYLMKQARYHGLYVYPITGLAGYGQQTNMKY